MPHKKLKLILAITVLITFAAPNYVQAQPGSESQKLDVTVEDSEPDIDPNVDLSTDGVEVNPRINLDPDIQVGGEDGAKINPDIDLRNGKLDADLNADYKNDINVGGENGVNVNPNVGFRNGRLSIDPKFDVSGAVDYVKERAISGITNFAIDRLGVGNFLLQLNQDFTAVVGDVKTFLGLRGKEAEIGSIGLPNIQEARITFDEDLELNQFNDVFGTQTGTTFSSRDELYQQYLRELSQEYSENSALSLEGQSKIEAKIDSANASAEQSVTIAEDSTNQDVSQNLLRNVSNQLGIQQQTDAIAIAEMQDDKIDRSLSLQLDSETLIETAKLNVHNERVSSGINSAAQNSFFLITIPGTPKE